MRRTGRRKLFLHVGAGKCGSTALQRFLNANTRLLGKLGFGIANADFRFDVPGGQPIRFFGFSDKPIAEMRDIVHARLDAAPQRALIASSEPLSSPRRAAIFSGLEDRFDISVLHLHRLQDDWIFSAWRQWGARRGLTLDAFVERSLRLSRPGYRQTVEAWRAVAGETNVRSQTIETLDRKGGLEALLLDWLGVTGAAKRFQQPKGTANKSFDGRIAGFMSAFPDAFPQRQDTRIDQLVSRHSRLAFQRQWGLPVETRAAIRAHFRDDNVWLMGEDVVAQLYARADAADAARRPHDTAAAEDVMLATATEMLAGISAEHEVLRGEIRKARGLFGTG